MSDPQHPPDGPDSQRADDDAAQDAWAFALGALEGDELAAAEERMHQDPEYAREVQSAREELALLALSAAPVEPSEAARQRFVEALEFESPFAPLVSSLARLADLGRDAVRDLVAQLTDLTRWEPGPGTGTTIFHLDGGPATAGAVVGFVKIAAGESFPEHRHGGDETVVVMQGAMHDSFDDTVAGPGDVVRRVAGTTHTVTAGDDEDVIFLVVVFEGVSVGDDFIGPGDPRL